MKSWLLERMEGWRAEPALVWAETRCTYGELLDAVATWLLELERHGLGAGSVVAIEGTFSPKACALLLALLERRAIAVPITPGSHVHRSDYETISEAEATFSFDPSDVVTVTRHARTPSHALTKKLQARGHAGLVIFSSGSSGVPRAVLHDFEALLEKFRTPRHRKTVLTFLLFDHIGGIDTLMNTLASGGLVVTTPSHAPEAVCALIERHRVHTLPTSPTFLNLLLVSEVWQQHDLSSLQTIAYGTEPMPAATLARLAAVFPETKLVQTYGMSELGVLRSRSKPDGSLWISFTNDGFETQVRDGVLWVRTPTAMLGYLNAPDLFDADGWLNTQDAVEVDGPWLRVLGRQSDLINVGGEKVYPAEVEAVVLRLSNVADVAVYGEKSPLTGQFVAARVNLVEPEPFDVFKRRLRAHCREHLEAFKVPVRIELTDEKQFSARFKKVRRPGS